MTAAPHFHSGLSDFQPYCTSVQAVASEKAAEEINANLSFIKVPTGKKMLETIEMVATKKAMHQAYMFFDLKSLINRNASVRNTKPDNNVPGLRKFMIGIW